MRNADGMRPAGREPNYGSAPEEGSGWTPNPNPLGERGSNELEPACVKCGQPLSRCRC